MATWEKMPPVTDAYDQLIVYVQSTYPDQPLSAAYDGNRKLIHLEMPNMADSDFSSLMTYLQTNFPGAF